MQETISKKVNMQEKGKLQTRKENEVKLSRGITLIALVVTIVVLLILAGVSIIVLFGDNGIIKQAEESSLQSKFADVEERANVIYADLDSKRYATGNTSKRVTMGEIAQELSNLKYDIKEIELGEGIVEAIELEPTSIKMGTNDTETIKVNLKKNEEGMGYYVKVQDKYYQISLKNGHVVLDRTNGKTVEEIKMLEKEKTEGTQTKKEVTAISSNDNIVTILQPITQTDEGATIQITSKEELETATITIGYEGVESKKCTVTVVIKPLEESANIENSITTDYGRIDVIWLDENNKVIPEPNAPILQSEKNGTVEAKTKMQAVKWIDKENRKIEESPADETNQNKEWYNYREKDIEEGVAESELKDNTTSHWANAKTENGSYFVWIPRYAYRITYYANETSTTPTGYYDGYGMWNAEDKKKKMEIEDGIETVEYNGKLYIVHPAFGTTKTDELSKTQNIELGGWDKPLAGFWFAKFEMSYQDEKGLRSVPAVQSVRRKTIGEFYTMARTATYGQKGAVDNKAGGGDENISFMSSHISKNSEWGAVAYLTHSKYGRNGNKVSTNYNNQYYVGGYDGTSYNGPENVVYNPAQSTTGNGYGIYDMNGASGEYIAAWEKGGEKNLQTYGASIPIQSGLSIKYFTVYHNISNISHKDKIYQGITRRCNKGNL